jgi:hypothetical protein
MWLFKCFLAVVGSMQKRWVLFAVFVVMLIVLNRLVFQKDWLYIIIVISFFVFKELFEYGRRKANAKAPWK